MVKVIAEIGLCHDGNLNKALRLVEAAAEAGCWGAKTQIRMNPHWFEDERPRPTERYSFGRTEGEHRRALELDRENHLILRDTANRHDLHYGASAWDEASVGFIRKELDFLKIGRPMIRYAEELLGVVLDQTTFVSVRNWTDMYRCLVSNVTFLACPGNYPDSMDDAQRVLNDLSSGSSGASLHMNNVDDLCQLASGLEWLEVHVCLDHTLHSDRQYSLNPEMLTGLVQRLS